MRDVILIGIVIIVLGAAWSLYLKYDTQRFIDSFPKVPATVAQPQNTTEEAISSSKNASPKNARVAQETLETFTEKPAVEVEDTKREKIETSTRMDFADEISEESPPSAFDSPPTQAPIGMLNLSREEIVENNRKHLIEIHGDIPEVHTFLKYFPFEVLLDVENKEKYEFSLSHEEFLEYQRANAVLFPNAANREGYQKALERELEKRALDFEKH
ncbi:MAG: hypothetical protein OXI24_02840 [Candidatus Poribacteria bacterium]|nr:hypothetical protein [Candidatus Poribacteria bacterium]